MTSGAPAPAHLDVRPVRLVRTCRISAVAMVCATVPVAVLVGGAPAGDAVSGLVDRAIVVLIGVLGAAGVLWFARPRVVADPARLLVRNLGPTREVPWQIVEGIRFDERTSWAVLLIADDDTMSMMAVQRADGDRARTAVAELRAMLEASRRQPRP